jgi:hypothetical protein
MYVKSGELIPVGTRVKCGLTHIGVLAGYFVGEMDLEFLSENASGTELFGIIKLDTEKVTNEGVHIKFLVVHVNNLELEESRGW